MRSPDLSERQHPAIDVPMAGGTHREATAADRFDDAIANARPRQDNIGRGALTERARSCMRTLAEAGLEVE